MSWYHDTRADGDTPRAEFLEDGKIDKELAEAAKVNAQRPDDSEKFGRAVMRVLGVARRETHEIGEKLGTAV